MRSCSESIDPEMRSVCTECEAEEVSCDTGRMSPEYAAIELHVNLKQRPCSIGHHARAICELRGGAVKARRPRGTRGRSEAQRLARRRAQLKAVTRDGPVGSSPPHEPILKAVETTWATHVTMSKQPGPEPAAEVVDEESANADQNAP